MSELAGRDMLLDLNSDQWEELPSLTLNDLRDFAGWVLDNPDAATRERRVGAIVRAARLYAYEFMREWNIANDDT